MAKLFVKDKVGLGRVIKEAATEPAKRAALLANPKAVLEKYVEIPPGNHTIKIHEDSADITHIVLPWSKNVENAFDRIDEEKGVYPGEYRPGSADFIDDTKFPRTALYFRFGEYMFGRCKD